MLLRVLPLLCMELLRMLLLLLCVHLLLLLSQCVQAGRRRHGGLWARGLAFVAMAREERHGLLHAAAGAGPHARWGNAGVWASRPPQQRLWCGAVVAVPRAPNTPASRCTRLCKPHIIVSWYKRSSRWPAVVRHSHGGWRPVRGPHLELDWPRQLWPPPHPQAPETLHPGPRFD